MRIQNSPPHEHRRRHLGLAALRHQHQCTLLEDELLITLQCLHKARANIAGLAQMNDLLCTGKAEAEAEKALTAVNQELEELKQAVSPTRILSIQLITEQRDLLVLGESAVAGGD